MPVVGRSSITTDDAARVAKMLRSRGVEGKQALGAALYGEANAIMNVSQARFVPVDTGTLRSTKYVSLPKFEGSSVTVEMGYGGPAAPYAFSVHENPRAGKTGGVSPSGKRYKSWAKVGQWKFLETPFKAAQPGLGERLATRMKERLK